jgi:hypothetical protein
MNKDMTAEILERIFKTLVINGRCPDPIIEDCVFFFNNLNKTFPWFSTLDMERQLILIEMCVIGWKNFIKLDKLFSAIEQKDFLGAAAEMWINHAKILGNRKEKLCTSMERGEYII